MVLPWRDSPVVLELHPIALFEIPESLRGLFEYIEQSDLGAQLRARHGNGKAQSATSP